MKCMSLWGLKDINTRRRSPNTGSIGRGQVLSLDTKDEDSLPAMRVLWWRNNKQDDLSEDSHPGLVVAEHPVLFHSIPL